MLAFIRTSLERFASDRRGNVAILAAVAMPVIIGSLGVGAEVASWYGGKRAMQGAADSAAIAAATNASDRYLEEARAVAARYGFVHGVDGVTVTGTDTAACPGGAAECYQVTIARNQPLLLAQAVGYEGDATIDGAPAKRISATAVAIQALAPREYCVLALAGSGYSEGIRANGVPFANLEGCNVMSNTDARCNGHDLNADIGDAAGTNNGCGNQQNSNVPAAADPYAALASNIPSRSCSSFPEMPDHRHDPPLPSSNRRSGALTQDWDFCGDGELFADTIVTQPNTRIIVRGGSLYMNGHTLQTLPGASVTIIFTGPGIGRDHSPKGGGGFDIEAPNSGAWSGIAMYQDPSLTSGVDIEEAGNSPTWDITGVVYLPKAYVEFSGAVNKSSNGASCFVLVMDHLRINGTGSILAHDECAQAGVTMPNSPTPSRGQLVS